MNKLVSMPLKIFDGNGGDEESQNKIKDIRWISLLKRQTDRVVGRRRR